MAVYIGTQRPATHFPSAAAGGQAIEPGNELANKSPMKVFGWPGIELGWTRGGKMESSRLILT